MANTKLTSKPACGTPCHGVFRRGRRISVSEYQYYEFLAIERPLSKEDMGVLRRITSRAEITPTRLCNVYNFGNFHGDPHALMRKYFDAMVYITNWGTRQLMLKLPRSSVDPKEIEPYCVERVLSMEANKDHVLLDIQNAAEDPDEWLVDHSAEGYLSSLVPLRGELQRGQFAGLYLAWLHGASLEFDPDDGEDAPFEPPLPPGLRSLSAPCRALCDFLDLDQDRVAAAAERSDKAASEDVSSDIRAWLKKVPAADKDGWLAQLVKGEGTRIEGEVLRRFRAERPRTNTRGTAPSPRTLAEILARAEVLGEEREKRDAKADARARAAHARAEAKALEQRVAALAKDEAGAWAAVDAHIASKDTGRYDQAVSMLYDLSVLAERNGKVADFEAQLRSLRERNATKQAFLRRLRDKGLGARRQAG
jgi:hypothetical protein